MTKWVITVTLAISIITSLSNNNSDKSYDWNYALLKLL